jgi:signal transduction histidine kinase
MTPHGRDRGHWAAGLHRALGTPGLLIGALSLLMVGFGLVIVQREYDRMGRTRSALVRRVVARWVRTASADYLGARNLTDDVELWRRGRPDLETARRAVERSLARLGAWFDQQATRAPFLQVVSLSLHGVGDEAPLNWPARPTPVADTLVERDIELLPAQGSLPAVHFDARVRVEAEVAGVLSGLEASYRRLLLAVLGLSGYSMLCLVYMGWHAHSLRQRASREAARQAALDLADRTCHELGNVAFVLSNERRNLADHLALVEALLEEHDAALDAALARARVEPDAAARLRSSLRRELTRRGLDFDAELRGGAALAREVCRQIDLCAQYIGLTVRELDGTLKQTTLPVQVAPLDAATVIDEALALLGPALSAAAARVERDLGADPVRVLADRRLLVHALVNILKNALEATRGAGVAPRLVVSAGGAADSAWIAVRDNGPGVAPALRGRLFEAGASTKGAGRGRGLVIVKDALAAQGARITWGNNPDAGATFRITLRRAAPAVNSEPEPLNEPVGSLLDSGS